MREPKKHSWKKGDIAAYRYGGPGPDISYLYLVDVNEDMAVGWDIISSHIKVTIPLDKLFIIENKNFLDGGFLRDMKPITFRQCLEELKRKLSW